MVRHLKLGEKGMITPTHTYLPTYPCTYVPNCPMVVCKTFEKVWFQENKLNGKPRGLYSIHFTFIVATKYALDKIRTANLRCRKRLLCLLCHSHCAKLR